MSSPVLYGMPISSGTRLTQWAASIANVNVEFKMVDLMKKDHMVDEFVALTRGRHCIPALTHGEFKMTESRAIAAYLLRLGEEEGQVKYILDSRTQAVVDEWVHYEATCMYKRVSAYAYHKLYGMGDSPSETEAERLNKSMEYIECRLKENCEKDKYLAGSVATLADLVVANCLSLLEAVPREVVDMVNYPYTHEWLERVARMGNYESILAPFKEFVQIKMSD